MVQVVIGDYHDDPEVALAKMSRNGEMILKIFHCSDLLRNWYLAQPI